MSSSSRRGGRRGAPASRSAPRRWYRRPGVWLALLVPLLIVGVLAAGLFLVLVQSVPVPSDLDTPATVVLDRDGEEIGELQPQANREDVALEELPDHVWQAVLAAEDASFYDHPGVSVPGILRALWSNVRSGEVGQGGSTISQQYVKNFTGDDEQSVARKVREAATAMKLEREYSKDQILELYLNTIYFGRGAYGIQAAARAYFDVDATELSVEQAALLAGVLPAPSAYDPEVAPEKAAERYDYVLGRMVDEGWLAADQAEQLRSDAPEVVAAQPLRSGPAPAYLSMVESELAEVVGESQRYRGLEVRTHLDLDQQEAAREHYDDAFEALADELAESAPDEEVPTGALVSIEPSTGGIRALIGGPRDSELNLATGGPDRAGRQPGSTFKPFALAAWIAQGLSPESLFPAPAQIEFTPEESGDPQGWTVSNYGEQGFGDLTLREATWRSVNTVYAQVAVEVEPSAIIDAAQAAGSERDFAPQPSIVLGTQEVTPLELTEMFSTFASGGVHHEPTTLLEVRRGGDVLVDPDLEGDRTMSEQIAWTVVDVLRGVIESGTGTAADIGRPAFGKTGTTQDSGDAWFAGATPNLATVVWMGNRDNREPMAGSPTGGGFPAQLWAAYMTDALEGVEPEDFPPPPGDLRVVGTPTPTPTPTPEPTEEPEPTPTPTPTEAPEDDEG